ncbi:hypothetical protein MF672_010855 [Actinomadura sp. ATCC 31491]|uniref:Big-1 domain-containing protein n=1 Tax=Actinomadura luzonensis TaxID=2805427 RepID=A0ABT0FPL4_9ACTN|nr:hypothetical protein [Actinomadura luzonensis]MCK2214286.1 hypothetical protein [Actinomadura luzonensis]
MLTRIARTRAATLRHVFEVDETPTDSAGPVTVEVTDATGTQVAAGPATSAGMGVYTFALPAQTGLALLTVAWAATIDGADVVETDEVEIVGGFYFSLRQGRASDSALSDTTKYSTEDLIQARTEVEVECERITQRAFVPRYRRVLLDGTGTRDLLLPDGGDDLVAGVQLRGVRVLRSATMSPRAGQPYVPLTTAQLGALVVTRDGLLRRGDGNVWTEGIGNVLLEYEYGSDAPPEDLVRASLVRFRSRLNIHKSGIPDRATSYTAADGGTYRLTMPGAAATGIPEVDAVYSRYSRGGNAGGADGRPVPASRILDYTPQRWSLFHQGRTS